MISLSIGHEVEEHKWGGLEDDLEIFSNQAFVMFDQVCWIDGGNVQRVNVECFPSFDQFSQLCDGQRVHEIAGHVFYYPKKEYMKNLDWSILASIKPCQMSYHES